MDGTYANAGVVGLGTLAAIEQNINITDSYGILASLNASRIQYILGFDTFRNRLQRQNR
jgi:hypothetical protein